MKDMNNTLNEIKDILKNIEENTRPFAHKAALEAKNFDVWLSQYDPEELARNAFPDDPEPYVPTQACSQEQMEHAQKLHREWEQRNSGNFSLDDYYVK